MHHKANSFHSQNLFLKSAVYAYGCWWVYSMKRKRTTKLSQTEVRPKGSETHMSVLRPDLWLVSAGITKCMVFRAEQLHDPRLPARRSREHSHVQLLQSRCSTEKNNLCCNNGTVKSFYEQTVMFCCLCGAESTCWVQAAEDWSVSVFTFQEERLGGLICIGLKWLQCYWQITRGGGQDAEPWNSSVTTF